MAHNSQTYMEAQRSLGLKAFLKKVIGCPFWAKTTPITLPDASDSTVKGMSKFGKANTGALVSANFSCSKAV